MGTHRMGSRLLEHIIPPLFFPPPPPTFRVSSWSSSYLSTNMNRAVPLARIVSSSFKATTSRPALLKLTTRPTTTTTTTPLLTRPRFLCTTSANMSAINANAVLENITNRRSYYPLSKDLTITPAKIQEIVKEALQQVPSSFNSQSNRVLVLFGAEHEKLWDIAIEVLKAIVPADGWESTSAKLNMFKASGGTVCPLFPFSPCPLLPLPPLSSR